jgi:hypothetical protein
MNTMGNLNFPHYDKLTELITYTYHTMDEFPGDESTLYKSIEDFSGDKNKMLLVDNMIKGFGRIAYVHLLRSVYESSTEEERLSGDVWKLSKELEIAKVLGVYPRANTPNKIDEQLFDLQVSVEEILENERIYD